MKRIAAINKPFRGAVGFIPNSEIEVGVGAAEAAAHMDALPPEGPVRMRTGERAYDAI